ncbi:MAG: phenylalanine--tRNA ligase subunit alpha, partial [Clostridia bacterium]|nr:phenylalanine--tRNA ligase subunit alpha [Clostridia bacterium]
MLDKLQEIKKIMEDDLREVTSTDRIQELKVKYLGKKGSLTQISKAMGSLSPDERPKAGQMVNEVRNHIEERLAAKLSELSQLQLAKQLAKEEIDVTLPGRNFILGSKHPVTMVIDQIKDIF